MSARPAMRAAVYLERGVVRVEEREVPRPAADEVLLRVSHCGICGTDLHFVMDGWGRPGSIGGHEFSGTIAAVGDSVVGWCIGDAAVAGADTGCGNCRYCRGHRVSLCDEKADAAMADYVGAFAEYKVVPAEQLHRIPDGLGLREAAIAEPLAVSLHGITQSGARPGQRILILGAGPVGMFTLAALKAQGVEDVTVSEPSPSRRELALRIGATVADVPEALESPGLPFQCVDAPFEVAIECSGKGAAIEAALAQLAKGGSMCLLGTGLERPRLDAMRVLLNELTITGAYTYDENGLSEALNWLASGLLPTHLLIEASDVGLDDLQPAMERLVSGVVAGKVLVVPN
jgi:threonine dehydrogenase-like Zn-dependent dehydrogenase